MVCRTLLAFFLAGSLWGQVAIDKRVVLVGFQAADGRFVTGVDAARIRVPAASSLLSLAMDAQPRRIVLLIDGSGSMKQSWPHVLALCRVFLSCLSAGDQVALEVFAQKHQTLLPYTSDLSLVDRQLTTLPVPGSQEAYRQRGRTTRMSTALEESLASNTAFQSGDAILLVSDGNVNQERRRDRSEEQLLRRGIRLFFAKVPDGRLYEEDSTLVKEPASYAEAARRNRVMWGPRLAEHLALSTGGAIIEPWVAAFVQTGRIDAALLPEAAHHAGVQACALIRHVYRVELEFPAPLTKPFPFAIDLADEGGKRSGIRALYPRFLMPRPVQ